MVTTQSNANATGRRRRRPKRRYRAARRDSICEVLLAIVVVGSVLAIGTVHIPTLLVIAALALIGATLEAVALRRVPRPALVLAALGVFSALQAVPLPAASALRLSPVSAEVWLRCLVPFGDSPVRSFSLSLDAGASTAEALKWLTYASVYIMAMRMRQRRGAAWLALLLFGSALLVTLVTLLHGIANVGVLYFLYHPGFSIGRWSVGPLLNSNNLAGYAILGLFSGGGLWLSGRSPLPRLPLTVGLGVISAALCLSGSRAGVVSVFAAGAVVLAWLTHVQRSRFSLRKTAFGVAPLAMGIAFAIALGTANDAGHLVSLDMRRKASVWFWSVPMIREHLLFGVGRGAFETAFSPYRQALEYDWSIVFTHAENFVVQWVAEWGVPVGLAAVVVIVGYVLREWYRAKNDRLCFMLMTGLVALLVQNLADLGLEIPALAIAAVVALAAGERQPKPPPESERRHGWLALAGTVPALAVWVAVLIWARSPVELERRELSEAYQALAIKSGAERARFHAELRAAVLRHPGESFFPLLGSLVAMRTGDGKALPWIARALALAPANGRVHLVLADLLQAHGATAQAIIHLRLAAQYDRTLAGAVGARAQRWAPTLDLLARAIPDGPLGASIFLDACTKEPRWELKIECFRRAALDNARSPEAQQRLAEYLLLAIQGGHAPCVGAVREQCLAQADAAIQATSKLDARSWHSAYLRAKSLIAHGDLAGATQLMTRVCPRNAEGDECWLSALATAIASGSEVAISAAANAYASRPCDGSQACADVLTSLGSSLEAGGQSALATTFFTKAAEVDPSAERWLKVAELAARARLDGVARAAIERADRSPDASLTSRAHSEQLMHRMHGAK